MARRRVAFRLRQQERAAREALGERIRAAREGRTPKWKQQDLADKVGLPTYKSVSLIESGDMNIPPDVCLRLEEALGLGRGTIFLEEARWRLIRLGFDPTGVADLMAAAAGDGAREAKAGTFR